MSNLLNLTVSDFNSGAHPVPVPTFFPPVKLRNGFHPIHRTVFKSASNSLRNVKGYILLLVQLGYLFVHAHFNVGDRIAGKILLQTSFIDTLVKEIFPMTRLASPSGLTESQLFQQTRRCWISWLYWRPAQTWKPVLTTYSAIVKW